MKKVAVIFMLGIWLAGCAHQTPATQPVAAIKPSIAPVAKLDPKSLLSLDEILPRPILPAAPATQASPAPDAALVLYARGMDELYSQHPYDAVQSLEDARLLDPNSYEINFALGRAHLDRIHEPNDRSFEAFEKAATIRPDDLEIHLLLGREYLAENKIDKAIEHLRLALQTSGYPHDIPGAASVDFFLARSLQQQGYERAALDCYARLIHRLTTYAHSLAGNDDIGFLVSSPQLIWQQIASLHEKLGEYAQALEVYEPLAKSDSTNFETQAKVVRMLALLGRVDEATESAADAVARFRASAESVGLLREVYQSLGREQDAVNVLRRLHLHNRSDRGLLFALADMLVAQGKFDDASGMMEEAIAKNPSDEQMVEKLFKLYMDHDDAPSAARVMIVYLSAQPDGLREINPMMMELIRPAGGNALHIAALQQVIVPDNAQAAKLYLVSRVAEFWQRDALERSAMEQATKIAPPFAPAFRSLTLNIWNRPDWDAKQKSAAVEALAMSAQTQGDASLAGEVRGLSFAASGDFHQAGAKFAEAEQLGANSPDFELTYAGLLRRLGENLRSEQMLWKLVAQRPRYDEAWESLYGFYLDAGKEADALKVLAQWLRADPGSAEARIRQALWFVKQGQAQAAQEQLTKLLEDHPDQIDVLRVADQFFRATSQSDQFFLKLEAIHAAQPRNFTLLSWLLSDYSEAHRLADSLRLLDETRAKVGNDPELLYQLSGMYQQIGQNQASQDILGSVIKADPTNGPASNDLGFAWADAGRNLDHAEQLIRVAIAAEPDNQAFLDSMGWVLYKRGKFDEAAKYFRLAIGPAALPDPEILDHFGDVLYRMGKTDDARKQWQRSLDRLDDQNNERASAGDLRLQLRKKLSAVAEGKPVNVAPVIENPVSAIKAG